MKRVVALCLLMWLCAASAPGLAQVYGGVLGGISEPQNDSIDEARFPPIDGDVGFKMFFGNQLAETFAFELGYISLGEYEVGNVEGAVIDPDEQSDSIAITGYEFSVIGEWPFAKNASLYGRLGVFRWEAEREIVVNDDAGTSSASLTVFDGTDMVVGLGARYDIVRNLGILLEADVYQTGGVYNLLYGLGVFVSF